MSIIVKRNALLSALAGARAAYPNEFICLLVGSREKDTILIEDTLIPPGISVSRGASMFSDWMTPLLDGVIGSFHSHPNGVARPSRQDGWLFSQKGGVNFIAAEPFGMKDTAAFIGSGKKVEFVVVD